MVFGEVVEGMDIVRKVSLGQGGVGRGVIPCWPVCRGLLVNRRGGWGGVQVFGTPMHTHMRAHTHTHTHFTCTLTVYTCSWSPPRPCLATSPPSAARLLSAESSKSAALVDVNSDCV